MWGHFVVDWAYVCGMADDSGNDCDEETHDPEGRCGNGASHEYTTRAAYGPRLRCNRCGDRNVYWQTVRGKYLLYDKAGLQPHECPPKENNLEGFDE